MRCKSKNNGDCVKKYSKRTESIWGYFLDFPIRICTTLITATMFGLHIYTFVFVYVRSYAYEPLFLGYHVFSRLLIYIALNRFTLTCSHDFCVHTIFLLFSIVRILQIPTQYGILFPFFSRKLSVIFPSTCYTFDCPTFYFVHSQSELVN